MAYRMRPVHDADEREADVRDDRVDVRGERGDVVEHDASGARYHDGHYEEVDAGPARTRTTTWSPLQLIGLLAGIGLMVLGIAAVGQIGFDTAHVETPQESVWRLPHSPLLAVSEMGLGLLLIVTAILPGAFSRALMGLLGAAALAFGLVVLLDVERERLNDWLGVTDRNGWFFTIVGAVVLAAAIASPVVTSTRRRHRRRVQYAAPATH
jgi:vacuolar-type H+-ATPase subunit I/STV1